MNYDDLSSHRGLLTEEDTNKKFQRVYTMTGNIPSSYAPIEVDQSQAKYQTLDDDTIKPKKNPGSEKKPILFTQSMSSSNFSENNQKNKYPSLDPPKNQLTQSMQVQNPNKADLITEICYYCNNKLLIPKQAVLFKCFYCSKVCNRAEKPIQPPLQKKIFICGKCKKTIAYDPISNYVRCVCGVVNYVPSIVQGTVVPDPMELSMSMMTQSQQKSVQQGLTQSQYIRDQNQQQYPYQQQQQQNIYPTQPNWATQSMYNYPIPQQPQPNTAPTNIPYYANYPYPHLQQGNNQPQPQIQDNNPKQAVLESKKSLEPVELKTFEVKVQPNMQTSQDTPQDTPTTDSNQAQEKVEHKTQEVTNLLDDDKASVVSEDGIDINVLNIKDEPEENNPEAKQLITENKPEIQQEKVTPTTQQQVKEIPANKTNTTQQTVQNNQPIYPNYPPFYPPQMMQPGQYPPYFPVGFMPYNPNQQGPKAQQFVPQPMYYPQPQFIPVYNPNVNTNSSNTNDKKKVNPSGQIDPRTTMQSPEQYNQFYQNFYNPSGQLMQSQFYPGQNLKYPNQNQYYQPAEKLDDD